MGARLEREVSEKMFQFLLNTALVVEWVTQVIIAVAADSEDVAQIVPLRKYFVARPAEEVVEQLLSRDSL